MRVLGIDPSLQSTGFGIIESSGGEYLSVGYGTINPSPRLPFPQRLHMIESEIEKIIGTYGPVEAAIENPFHAQNVKTALTLGQVRGAILVALAARRCELHEYSALEIKKAVTGYGRADKSQVQVMVRALLRIDDDDMASDASDALAAAICHLNSRIFREKLAESG